MRGFGRAVLVALVAATLLPAGLASAAKTRTYKDVSVTAIGSLTYTWSGDPALGCAAVGLCGVHGELVLRPQTSGQSVSTGPGPVSVQLDTSDAARVVRQEGGVVVGECVDLPASSFDMLSFSPPARGGSTKATVQVPPSSGRCAGPTSADLADVSVPVRRTGQLAFDLAGTRSFTAGPFSGTLVSTVRLVPAPGSSEGSTGTLVSSGSSSPGPTATHPMLEFVRLQYRISTAPNTIQAQFSGASGPTCQLLDSCGSSGSFAFSVQPSRAVTFIATRRVHRRVSRRQALSDLRQGRLSLSTFVVLAGRVTEVFDWPNGPSCRDAVVTPSLILNDGSAGGPQVGRTIQVSLVSNGAGSGASVFRTHCPGPSDADIFGGSANYGSQPYAHGVLTTGQLLARQSVLTLSDPGSFSGFGYVGTRTGSIVLNLTLTKVTAETQR